MRAQPQQWLAMRFQLGEDDAHRLRPRRRLHVQQFLHRQAVAQAVGDGGHVVHAVHVGVELRVGAVFGDLLHPPVQVTDDAIGAHHLFAV